MGRDRGEVFQSPFDCEIFVSHCGMKPHLCVRVVYRELWGQTDLGLKHGSVTNSLGTVGRFSL